MVTLRKPVSKLLDHGGRQYFQGRCDLTLSDIANVTGRHVAYHQARDLLVPPLDIIKKDGKTFDLCNIFKDIHYLIEI